MKYREQRMVLEGRLRKTNSWQRSGSALIFASARQHHALLAIIHSRQKYSDSSMIQKGKSTLLQCFPKNSFAANVYITLELFMNAAEWLFHFINFYQLTVGNLYVGARQQSFRKIDIHISSKGDFVTVGVSIAIIFTLKCSDSWNEARNTGPKSQYWSSYLFHMCHWEYNGVRTILRDFNTRKIEFNGKRSKYLRIFCSHIQICLKYFAFRLYWGGQNHFWYRYLPWKCNNSP